jgi:hypothetical protein
MSCLRKLRSPTLLDDKGDERQDFNRNEMVAPSPKSESTYLMHYMSSEKVWQHFCGRCGTMLTYALAEWPVEGMPKTLDVMMGTLDRGGLGEGGV